jgi:phosphopantothenoylcysteine decarboxylase/phosphopantothenate--cysteine ligase
MYKKILLGITGGIAAYKSADLVRRLCQKNISVRVVMTKSAEQFVGPLTFHALSGYPVTTDNSATQSDAAMDHIAQARWADAILIAPATADFMAKLACGLADNVLNTLCLACEVPIILVPAMNQGMWKNAATQANKNTLLQRGVRLLGPVEGDQACGENGLGRMMEPADILKALNII